MIGRGDSSWANGGVVRYLEKKSDQHPLLRDTSTESYLPRGGITRFPKAESSLYFRMKTPLAGRGSVAERSLELPSGGLDVKWRRMTRDESERRHLDDIHIRPPGSEHRQRRMIYVTKGSISKWF